MIKAFLFYTFVSIVGSPAFAQNPYPVLVNDGIPWDFEQPPGPVYAIGDIHGDFDSLVLILEKLSLINGEGHWIGGNATLIFVGDLVDRGPDSRIVMDLILALEKESQEKGGSVHTLLGNHEIKVVKGRESHLNPRDYLAFSELGGIPKAFHGDTVYAKWFRQRNSVIKIGRTLFIHAGVEEWAKFTTPPGINATVRAWVAYLQGLRKRPPETTKWIFNSSGPIRTRLFSLNGDSPPPPLNLQSARAQMRETLNQWGVDTVVVGHSVVPEILTHPIYGESVIMIDTNISKPDRGKLSALIYEKGNFSRASFLRSPERMATKSVAKRRRFENPDWYKNFENKSVVDKLLLCNTMLGE